MHTEFIFIRHGQAEGNLGDIVLGTLESPLTDIGRAQARETAEKIADLHPDFLYSSPIGRAYETAQIIAKRLNTEALADPNLRERFVGERIQGKTHAELRILLASEYKLLADMDAEHKLDFLFSLSPDAETPRAAADRLLFFIEEKGAQHQGKKVAAVTHAAALGPLLVSLGGLPFQGPFGGDGIANAAMSFLRFDPAQKRVEYLPAS